MKFKKVSENKIKIILSVAELESRNIDIGNLKDNSVAYQKLFWDMMEKAQAEFGFDVSGSQLMVETSPDMNGNVTITITKSLINKGPANLNIIEKIISEIVGNVQEDMQTQNPGNLSGLQGLLGISGDLEGEFENEVICFDKIDDAIDFCKSVKNHNNIASSLYGFGDNYFLSFKRTKRNNKIISNLMELALEFNGYINESYLLQSMLEERGSKLIKTRAIKTLAESF